MANKDVLTALQKTISKRLQAEMPVLKAVYEDWPSPSETLKYPCAAVTIGSPEFTPTDPYVFKKGAVDPETGKSPVARVVGSYEIRVQIDVWCASKPQRRDLYQQLFNVINPIASRPGLNLPLEDYFDAIAHLHLEGFSFPDGDEQVQRKEYRILGAVVCSALHIVETMESLMQTIENTTEIADAIEDEAPGEPEISI